MAAYCTYSDVAAQLKRVTISATSSPTQTEVGGYADLVTADMDSKMQAVGITCPVTDATKLVVLKQISVNGVVAVLLRAIQADLDEAEMRQKLYDDALAQIMKTPAIIQSAQGSGGGPSGSTAQTTRPFRRDEQDW